MSNDIGGREVNLQNRKVKIVLGLLLAVCVIIGYRIYSNIQADRARAAKMAQARSIAVVTAHPVRRTIVPQLHFSGSLDPEWQAPAATPPPSHTASPSEPNPSRPYADSSAHRDSCPSH